MIHTIYPIGPPSLKVRRVNQVLLTKNYTAIAGYGK